MNERKLALQYCPRCKKDVQPGVRPQTETQQVRGEPVTIRSSVAVCSSCGEDLFVEELEEQNSAQAYDEYRRRHGLLTPAEIRELRQHYGLSQRALALLLGWGEVTISRYENGALQNRAHDTVLRLIADPENMARVFKTSEAQLPRETIQHLHRRLSDLAPSTRSASLEVCIGQRLEEGEPGEMNGFRTLDLNTVAAMVLYLVRSVNHPFKTKITKLLWYTDFLHFKASARSLSGCTYLAAPYGPVPKSYELLFAYMIERGLLESEEVRFASAEGDDITAEQLRSTAEPELEILDPLAVRCLEAVAKEFRSLSSGDTVARAHQEPAYMQTRRANGPWQPIPYFLADSLNLSLPERNG